MRDRLGNVVVWLWVVAGLVVFVAAEFARHSKDGPPLWVWILGAVVLVPGLLLFGLWSHDGDHDGRGVGWWRGLPSALRPLGVWATVAGIVFFGLVLPALGVLYLVEGNLAGKLIGAVLLGVSLVWFVRMFRRRK